MPLKITSKTKSKVDDLVTELKVPKAVRQSIDACHKMADSIKNMKDELKQFATQYTKSKDAVLEYAETVLDADDAAILQGDIALLNLGQKADTVTEVNVEAAFEILGEETFVSIVNLPIGKLQEYCTPEELAKIVTRERVGNRSWKTEDKLVPISL